MIAIEESAFVGLMVLLGLLLTILTIKPVMIQKQYIVIDNLQFISKDMLSLEYM